MNSSPLLENLIENLKLLPSVGPKSAQRMAYYLLQHQRQGGLNLAKSLTEAMTKIGHCELCQTFTEEDICNICQNPRRQQNGTLCIVEQPADIQAIEQTGQFSGRYFVLMGHLSPLDGIGPREIGLDKLQQRLQNEQFSEVILATNPTVEGDVTANYIAELCQPFNLKISRIAHGIPVGAELENTDGTTLIHSFLGRRDFK